MHVSNIELSPNVEFLSAFSLDSPTAKQSVLDGSLQFKGWAIAAQNEEVVLEFSNSYGMLITKYRCIDVRYDVWAARQKKNEQDIFSGFMVYISPAEIFPIDSIIIHAIIGKKSFFISKISVTRNIDVPIPADNISALYLRTVGRTSSTSVMRLLSSHKDIVVNEDNSCEFFYAQYQAALYKLQLRGLDHQNWGMELNIYKNESAVGANPFLYGRYNSANDLLFKNAIRQAAFYAGNVQDIYTNLAESQEKSPRFFAEKVFDGRAMLASGILYPDMKTIYLVRHPAAIYLSMKRFAGNLDETKDANRFFYDSISLLTLEYQNVKHKNSNILIRQEEMVEDFDDVVHRISKFINAEMDVSEVRSYIESRLKFGKFQNESTITSSNLKSSVTEWKKALSDEEKDFIVTNCGAYMKEFDYEI